MLLLPCHRIGMGRTKTRTKRVDRKQNITLDSHTSGTNPGPSTSALYEKAQTLVEQCDYELAAKFLRRILDTDGVHIEAQELLGVVLLELGDLSTAEKVCDNLQYAPPLRLDL
jgi:Flp pilus assembly protein TadD